MTSVWCLQFSNKLNGGNQALAAFFNDLLKGYGVTLVLRGELSSFVKICRKNREDWVVVSDPLCALVLFLLRFQKVIHFVQSDDYDLFHERGWVFNFLYRRAYSALAKFTNWKRVFNSDYSRLKFNFRFDRSYVKDSVVPMLGLRKLFPTHAQTSTGKKKTGNGNVLWVGSKHAFKGGETFIRVLDRIGTHGTMLFAGEIPYWATNVKNIEIKSNLSREEIFKQMEKASCYVYTSRFDSFGLPMFEAIYKGIPVVAITNECVQLNKTTNFVLVVEDETELEKTLSAGMYKNYQPNLVVEWKTERQRLLDWIDLKFSYLQSSKT